MARLARVVVEGVEVWGYCLMPNHVHLIRTPSDAGGLRAALAEAHRRYSRRVNLREGWRCGLRTGRGRVRGRILRARGMVW